MKMTAILILSAVFSAATAIALNNDVTSISTEQMEQNTATTHSHGMSQSIFDYYLTVEELSAIPPNCSWTEFRCR
jgi:hypothetical protein